MCNFSYLQDPYVTRPLPYLIGTPQFIEDDNVGLTEDISSKMFVCLFVGLLMRLFVFNAGHRLTHAQHMKGKKETHTHKLCK